jgi:hypothetical protein
MVVSPDQAAMLKSLATAIRTGAEPSLNAEIKRL